MKTNKSIQSQSAVIIGKIVNTILAIAGSIFCIYGIYLQVTHNL